MCWGVCPILRPTCDSGPCLSLTHSYPRSCGPWFCRMVSSLTPLLGAWSCGRSSRSGQFSLWAFWCSWRVCPLSCTRSVYIGWSSSPSSIPVSAMHSNPSRLKSFSLWPKPLGTNKSPPPTFLAPGAKHPICSPWSYPHTQLIHHRVLLHTFNIFSLNFQF
uniref:Uncharacterized protein n=1 Tax=Cacopsylla melanoneura TaxID=428564 RepID=A0A8D8R1D2_9HEMI